MRLIGDRPAGAWRGRRRVVRAGVALCLTASVAACTSGSPREVGPADRPATVDVALPLSAYDLVVIASAENNPLFADVYGVTLDPAMAYRVTTDKRISSLDANAQRIVVAAADGPADRLAYVTDTGELQPIPGLGRPFAYTPEFRDDGSIVFADLVGTDSTSTNRYLAWNERDREKRVLFRSEKELNGPTPGPDSSLAFLLYKETGDDAVVLREASGKMLTFPLNGDGGYVHWGRTFIAATLNGAGSEFGDKASGMVLIDPDTGEQTPVPGWQPIAWTADGERLLVRKAGDEANSELALLDPARPSAPEPVGTIPDLAIYTGAWVRGMS